MLTIAMIKYLPSLTVVRAFIKGSSNTCVGGSARSQLNRSSQGYLKCNTRTI